MHPHLTTQYASSVLFPLSNYLTRKEVLCAELLAYT